jgi:hypothetical protein
LLDLVSRVVGLRSAFALDRLEKALPNNGKGNLYFWFSPWVVDPVKRYFGGSDQRRVPSQPNRMRERQLH